MAGAYETKQYRNVFAEYGYSEEEIEKRVQETFETIFHGSEEERFYHEAGEDMGFMEDTGNHDARTEGMSYGMMVCVQLDKKEEFDRLWKWTRTYMYMDEGPGKNYFAWSCALDGTRNADGPAPDGEEYFAMALFFASRRWGDGEGIFNYSREAKAILHECVHKGEPGHPGDPMWEPSNKLIKFVPGLDFSDPSYHLPHFTSFCGNMPMRRIVSSGKALPKQAGPTCIKPVIRIPDCRQSMRIMTEPRTARIRRSSAATTGITVMPIARSQISRWTICGLTRTRGRCRLQRNSRNFTARIRRITGTVSF